MKLSISVLCCHFACWLPLSVYGIVRACGIESETVAEITFGIAILNSFLDPLVYLHHIRRSMARVAAKLVACVTAFSSNPNGGDSRGSLSLEDIVMNRVELLKVNNKEEYSTS